MNNDIKKAIDFHKIGELDKAEELYLSLIDKKNDSALLNLLGTLYLQKEKYELSKKYLKKSFDIDPTNPSTLNNLGILEKKLKNQIKAAEYFEINIEKNNFLNSWVNKSNILLENKDFKEGLIFSKRAIVNYPKNIKIRSNYAIFLFNCGYKNESLNIYNEFDNEKLHSVDSLINYSNILFQVRDYKNALTVINQLLFIEKKNLNGLILRHQIYKITLDNLRAEEDILLALTIDKSNLLTNKTLVEFYIDINKHEKAIPYCDLMINAEMEKIFFFNKRIICKIYLGMWKGLINDLDIFNKSLKIDNSFMNPLFIKYLNDDPSMQKKITEEYWINKTKENYLYKVDFNADHHKNKSKIRLGYFSGDFRDHAVFQLIQDLLLNHNKDSFEIFAYSSFKKEGPSRNKIIEYVDHFFDIDDKSDEDTINLIKSHSLDVAIDLSGHTKYSNSDFFEFDIAKIKINYLGFPGTMGTTKYDFILADKFIIPEQHKSYYTESVIYLPENYQPYSPIPFDFDIKRSNFDLPNNIFILGCFSRIEKILPNVFDIWMNILKKHKDSYLALCINSDIVKNNINIYCQENEFDFNRIIFLEPIKHIENLKRMSTFDLYLDTYPYNGHTGISDSLFQSCVPTISFTGNSFASRVSLSLLNTLNLSKLITSNEKEYFDKIDYFCSNRNELKMIKDYLIDYKSKNLNRMIKFTEDFENLMLNLIKKNHANELNHKVELNEK